MQSRVSVAVRALQKGLVTLVDNVAASRHRRHLSIHFGNSSIALGFTNSGLDSPSA
jgi:hypothetical protein